MPNFANAHVGANRHVAMANGCISAVTRHIQHVDWMCQHCERMSDMSAQSTDMSTRPSTCQCSKPTCQCNKTTPQPHLRQCPCTHGLLQDTAPISRWSGLRG